MIKTKYKTSKIKFCILIIIILCGFQFYNYYGLSNTIQKLPLMVMIPLLFISTFKQLLVKEKDVFYRAFRWLLILWGLSLFSAYIFWDQPIVHTYRASANYFFFIIFFYFCKERIRIDSLEKIIVLFGWLYIILWLYAMFRAPSLTFGVSEDNEVSDNMQRGMLRINFTGRLSLIFAYFYYLNKCFIERRPKFIIFAGIFFVFIVLQLTRQLILWAGVVSIIYIFLRAKKLAVALSILFFAMYAGVTNIHFSDNNIIGAMINLTYDQAKYAGDDIRVEEYRYFLTDWSPNVVTSLIGNGMPHSETEYGHYYQTLQNNGFFLSDVGYPCMYVLVGVLGLAIYLFLYIKGAFLKLPKEYNYVNMFLLFLIPANIAASWYGGADTQLAFSICIYIIYVQRKKSHSLK